jgi:DNA topoisomerase-3
VFEQPMAYLCEKSVGPNKSCDFRSGKVILQQEIAPEQMRKLLDDGRTDILRGFVSNRTRRKFAAFLVRKPDGGVGFEFEPRAPRAGKAGAGDSENGAAPSSDERAGKATASTAARKTVKSTAAAKSAVKSAAKSAMKSAARSTTKSALAAPGAKAVKAGAAKATARPAAKGARKTSGPA